MNKKGVILMAAGVVLIIGALSLVIYNRWDDAQAGTSAAAAVTKIERQIPKTAPSDGTVATKTTAAEISGNSYIGIVKIPSLRLSLPVMSEWSYKLLHLAPCRYNGSPEGGKFIIAAHNYDSHFGRIHDLSPGDPVTFTTMNGKVYRYTVTALETLASNDTAKMQTGMWDLTLFTCTLSGQQRVTVRCALAGNS